MSNLKKMLSVFMAVAMLMSVMVMGTGATFTDQKDVTNTEAVDMNVALGIIKGYEDGSFKPTANVTRAEMAKMICIMLNGGVDPTLGTVTTTTFTDTKNHWAAAYIEYCASEGIIVGIGNNLFAPDATVTATQAAKMMLVAMGYDAVTEGYNGATWAVAINVRANAKGLYSGVSSVDPNAPLNRDNAARMIWNALNAGMVEYTPTLGMVNGQMATIKTLKDKTFVKGNVTSNSTLLIERFKAETNFVGVMQDYTWDKTNKEFKYTIEGRNENTTDTLANKTFRSKVDYTGLFGLTTKVVYKLDSNGKMMVYGMFSKDSKILASGTLNDLGKVDKDTIKFDGVKYKINYTTGSDDKTTLGNLPLMPEHVWKTLKAGTDDYKGVTADGTANLSYQVKLIDSNNDDKVDFGIYLPFTYGKVSSVGNKTISLVDGTATVLKIEDDTIYEGIAKNDCVKVINADNSAYAGNTAIKMESISGTVTGTRGSSPDYKFQVDGTWYTNANLTKKVNPSVGSKSTFYKVGSYVYFADQVTAATIDNVLYVAETDQSGMTNNAKVYFADATSATVSVSEVRDHTGTKLDFGTTTGKVDFRKDDVGNAANKMYTYSKKGSEYVLKQLGDNNNLGYTVLSDTSTSNKIGQATDKRSGKLTVKNKSFSFADEAIVFIEQANNSVKVVTGKVARDYSSDVVSKNLNTTVVYEEDANGTNANMARAVCMVLGADVPSSKGETGNYAYVLSDSYTTKIGDDNYKAVSIWNGTKAVDVTYEDNLDSLFKGQIIKYSTIGENKIDLEGGYLLDSLSKVTETGTIDVGLAAVKSMSDGNKTLTLVEGDTAGTSVAHGEYYLTKDTKYLYVDTENKKGEDTGAINLAIKESGNYKNNVMIYVDNNSSTDRDIDLIVVDTSNLWVKYATPTP